MAYVLQYADENRINRQTRNQITHQTKGTLVCFLTEKHGKTKYFYALLLLFCDTFRNQKTLPLNRLGKRPPYS